MVCEDSVPCIFLRIARRVLPCYCQTTADSSLDPIQHPAHPGRVRPSVQACAKDCPKDRLACVSSDVANTKNESWPATSVEVEAQLANEQSGRSRGNVNAFLSRLALRIYTVHYQPSVPIPIRFIVARSHERVGRQRSPLLVFLAVHRSRCVNTIAALG